MLPFPTQTTWKHDPFSSELSKYRAFQKGMGLYASHPLLIRTSHFSASKLSPGTHTVLTNENPWFFFLKKITGSGWLSILGGVKLGSQKGWFLDGISQIIVGLDTIISRKIIHVQNVSRLRCGFMHSLLFWQLHAFPSLLSSSCLNQSKCLNIFILKINGIWLADDQNFNVFFWCVGGGAWELARLCAWLLFARLCAVECTIMFCFFMIIWEKYLFGVGFFPCNFWFACYQVIAKLVM